MAHLDLGSRVGKYEIIRRLSVGGMAEIFLAQIAGPGGFRKVLTLKCILPDLKEEEGFVEMFLEEARISACLAHYNIAQVFDLGDIDDVLFIAMEFIPGEDLARIRKMAAKRNLRIPVGLTAKVIKDVCLALHYAHHFTDPSGAPMPIIHRDLSPKNVMVTYSGGVKMIDFGIAKAKGALPRTHHGMVKGSSGYMSPEQVLGGVLDGRSDLFAAGVLLHEFLSGERLFLTASETDAMKAVLEAPIRPPITIAPDVPVALSDVAVKATSRDLNARFATGKEMARAIDEALGNKVFDDEQVSMWMSGLFPDGSSNVRALLRQGDSNRQLSDDADEVPPAPPSPPSNPSSNLKKRLREEEPRTTAAPPPSLRPPAAPRSSIKTVLAVDDSPTALALLAAYLTREGYRVLRSTSAKEALNLLESETPDIIVLDVMMPEMNGFELCGRIRQRDALKFVPIVFVSAACSLEERLLGLNMGGDDFIRKPYEPAELAGRLRMHLKRLAMIYEQR